jgi:DNA-binding NtrC family response regulator
MIDRIVKVVIIDDSKDLTSLYNEILLEKQTFDVKTDLNGKSACKLIDDFKPEVVIADLDKFREHVELLTATKQIDAIVIWASRFQTIEFDDLPHAARILNKPFRPVDVKFAIRSELNKANRPAYIQI